jgi:putative hemolysin
MDDAGWLYFWLSALQRGHIALLLASARLDSQFWGQLIGLIVVLLLAALASAAETSLTSANRIKIKNLAEEGNAAARRVEQLQQNPNRFLTTILVVNSVALIVASALATGLALRFSQNYGELISSIVVSVVVLIFCEIAPKTAAVQDPERFARALVNPVYAAAWVLRPIIMVLTFLTTFLIRMLGGQIRRRGPFLTEEELRLMVTVGEQEGVLEEEETEMIHGIFELSDTPVREIMVPRIDMVTLEANMTVGQAVDLALQVGLSRIPVYETTIDNIIGVLYTKDLLLHLRQGREDAKLRDIVRPAYFVPETKKLDDLLHELQSQRVHMAIVIDEYGSVAGLVTIEDLVEEIIGDIQDEYDKEELLFERTGEREYIIDAKISISDLNELLGTRIEAEDYETLGGLVYTQLDKIPVVGDVVHYQNLTITVLATKGRRVTKVKVELGTDGDSAATSHSEDARVLREEGLHQGAERRGR